jgi:cytidine deaminase
MPILMYDKDGKSVVMALGQLLPMSFGPEKLLSTGQLALEPPQEAPHEEN